MLKDFLNNKYQKYKNKQKIKKKQKGWVFFLIIIKNISLIIKLQTIVLIFVVNYSRFIYLQN